MMMMMVMITMMAMVREMVVIMVIAFIIRVNHRVAADICGRISIRAVRPRLFASALLCLCASANHPMCVHDAGGLHSLQLMGKYAQTTAMYSLYSLCSGRGWAPSPINYRRCAACTCVLVSFSKIRNNIL